MDTVMLDGWLLPLAGVSSTRKWDHDLVYAVAGKMFAVHCVDGADAGRLSFKVEDDRFLELTDRDGIVPAPYLARARWVTLPKPDDFEAEWIHERLLISYRLVRAKLPKQVQATLG
jgi:predicted DNA-binding protein (MmcQ/YjbR family)